MTPSPQLERLAGAVLCVGFRGSTPAQAPLDALADLRPGGIVLFSRNATSAQATRELSAAVRAAIAERTGTLPFVAMDQEGGRVQRLQRGVHDVPPMMAVGAAANEALAEDVGTVLGADLRAAGVNVDFAPVMDLALQPEGTVLGNRCFGDCPESTSALGTAVLRGIQSQGVAATLKHFPGHGATASDTHRSLPVVDEGQATLRTRDLVPFAKGIAAGARAVMSAHVVFSAFDAVWPATLSRRILHDLLRVELGFAGVCFTDCMEMGAIARDVGTVSGAVLALEAGADCILISHSLDVAKQTRSAIAGAVQAGEIPFERLQNAAERIRQLANGGAVHTVAPADENAVQRAARAAVTLLRTSRVEGLRLTGPLTIVSFEPASHTDADERTHERPSLAVSLRRRRLSAELLRVRGEPDREMVEQLLAVVAARTSHELIILSRRAHRSSVQRSAIAHLIAAEPNAILVSALEPFDVALFPQARTVLCTYGDEAIMMEALADVLAGSVEPSGRLPVHLC